MFASKHPNVYSLCVLVGTLGERKRKTTCVLLLPNKRVIWNSRWPRVANESSTSPPPLCIFTPPTCILLAWLLWSKITQNFPFYKTMQAKSGFFILNIKRKSKKSFSAPLSPGRERVIWVTPSSPPPPHTQQETYTHGARVQNFFSKNTWPSFKEEEYTAASLNPNKLWKSHMWDAQESAESNRECMKHTKKYGNPFIFLDYPWSLVYLFMFAGFVLYSRIPIFSTDATIIIIYYIALCWV